MHDKALCGSPYQPQNFCLTYSYKHPPLNTNSNIFSLKNTLPKMYLKNLYGISMKLYSLYLNNDDAGIMLPQTNMALKKS